MERYPRFLLISYRIVDPSIDVPSEPSQVSNVNSESEEDYSLAFDDSVFETSTDPQEEVLIRSSFHVTS